MTNDQRPPNSDLAKLYHGDHFYVMGVCTYCGFDKGAGCVCEKIEEYQRRSIHQINLDIARAISEMN